MYTVTCYMHTYTCRHHASINHFRLTIGIGVMFYLYVGIVVYLYVHMLVCRTIVDAPTDFL